MCLACCGTQRGENCLNWWTWLFSRSNKNSFKVKTKPGRNDLIKQLRSRNGTMLRMSLGFDKRKRADLCFQVIVRQRGNGWNPRQDRIYSSQQPAKIESLLCPVNLWWHQDFRKQMKVDIHSGKARILCSMNSIPGRQWIEYIWNNCLMWLLEKVQNATLE